jgi:hypothetical protein
MSDEKSNIRTMGDRAADLWGRVMSYLEVRAQSQVNAWGSTLQYKRRYTNPDSAKQFRTPIEEIKVARAISQFRA